MFKTLLTAAALLGMNSTVSAEPAKKSNVGSVNFVSCITESKSGKKEQENLENIRKQLSTVIEDTEKELREIAGKFEDTEYLDSLSPKAEEELRNKFQALQDDLGRHQNQFYQTLNFFNQQMIQKIGSNIAKAAEKIADEQHLDYVINKEACFFIRSNLDVTASVIEEMDNQYEIEAKAAEVKSADESRAG
jgi:outer membrane protein